MSENEINDFTITGESADLLFVIKETPASLTDLTIPMEKSRGSLWYQAQKLLKVGLVEKIRTKGHRVLFQLTELGKTLTATE